MTVTIAWSVVLLALIPVGLFVAGVGAMLMDVSDFWCLILIWIGLAAAAFGLIAGVWRIGYLMGAG